MEKKTKEVKQTDRQTARAIHQAKDEQATPENSQHGLFIEFSPVQLNQIMILSQIAHNEPPSDYCKKVIMQHVADRLYLVMK